ncbi:MULTISPECIES: Lrp/AsnC family transcriptional regulator [unclassified Pseudoalteromonas]|uniref:Lrp/AsnC family transcriptional regulator n=1 Tax=unclassified Pseudoalteromonas TaxID=194690 RepID=UPI0006D5F205|nr:MULTISPECIES: Lrp/AsnC family transcriptional regulator [unclassified Pseudoalteromonas]KPV97057.1 Leucine-responsive regulatory protein [Pseudoalteromonas sp. P1-9]MCF6455573.1 Lrp/AsnC family transcriptional regulator [Pseudoalteromonas sp. MMG024]
MDKFNEQILFELSRDSSLTNIQLAERIGLSPSACLRRVQELERAKIITGYKATIDTEQLGIGFKAFITVGLSVHTKTAQTQFEEAITFSKEVLECHNVTGAFEYILRVETKDLKSYKQFHTNVLGDIEQVATITTHVVMDSVKDS